jgi:hypothetical protein
MTKTTAPPTWRDDYKWGFRVADGGRIEPLTKSEAEAAVARAINRALKKVIWPPSHGCRPSPACEAGRFVTSLYDIRREIRRPTRSAGDPIVVVQRQYRTWRACAAGRVLLLRRKIGAGSPLALDILDRELGVKRLLLEGGEVPTVDELNLILCLAVDGGTERLRLYGCGGRPSPNPRDGDDAGEQPGLGRRRAVAELLDPERGFQGDQSVKLQYARHRPDQIVVIGTGGLR